MSDLADLRKRAVEQSQTGNYWAGKTLGLIDRLVEARQALWDVYGILGFDTDGDTTPDALKHPPLTVLVREAARESREDYDMAVGEAEGELQLAAQSIGAPDWATARALMAAYVQHPNRIELEEALRAAGDLLVALPPAHLARERDAVLDRIDVLAPSPVDTVEDTE